jgi:hypothetical protein
MPLDDQQRKLIEAALAQKLTATRSDLLKKFPLEITVSPEYSGYLNPRVTVLVDSSVAFEVTHLKFTPVPEAGFVAVEACLATDAGAELFTRRDSGRTGSVPMKAALHGFTLNFPDDRKLKLPVESNTVTIDGQERTLVMIQVKRPARRKVLLRPRKKSAAATSTPAPAAALAAAKQPEAEARQPATNQGETEKQA